MSCLDALRVSTAGDAKVRKSRHQEGTADLELLELPLVLEGPCGGRVEEVVQRTGAVSHETKSAGRRGITGN